MEIHNIYYLHQIWKHIEELNAKILPTQSYEYYRYLFLTFYFRVKNVGRWRLLFHYFNNGQDECIIPLIINNKRRKIRSVSYYGRMDYDGVIATTHSKEFISACLVELCEQYPHYEMIWKNVYELDSLYPLIQEIAVLQEPCVSIELPTLYDDYYKSLSKHQRQNIRTSYNRLAADSISFSFKKYDSPHPLESSIWKQCEEIYEMRHNMIHNSYWRQILGRYTNPYHYILKRHSNHKIFVLFAWNIPMAYMAGIYNENLKTYYVPRLCINEAFYKYSPGILLVNETIKYLLSEGAQVLDLMQGDEPYKFAMGGITHNLYTLQTTTDELLKHVHSA